jgi:hypothetical protein
MNYDYDPCDGETYDENWEFSSTVNELIQKEVTARSNSFKEHYENLKSENSKLQQNLYEKNMEVQYLSAQLHDMVTKNKLFETILSRLNKDTIQDYIALTYEPDFNEDGQFETPLWFKLIVNYYSHRDEIIDLLKVFDINIPKWVLTFRLPFEWTKGELDHFFNTIYNHYVCNGQIYSHNLNFWMGEKIDDPIANMNKNYSEIPWQFVLRHPLLNTPEYCKKMADAINKGGNGVYFAVITDYQNLSDENLDILINGIDFSKIKKLNDNNAFSRLMLNNIGRIKDVSNLDLIYPLLINVWRAETYISKMPKRYYIKFLKSNGTNDLIINSTILTKPEKLELLSDII